LTLIGAIEAGGTKFVLALARADGTIIETTRIETRAPQPTFADMTAWFADAAARHGAIGAFGVASFGPIGIDTAAPDYGTFLSTVKPHWEGANLVAALAAFRAPVAIDTDVNGAALAEALHGAGRGHGTVAYTTVGTGIGTGVLADGAILKGATHYETGHFHPPHDRAQDPFDGICVYHRDCLEGLASGPAIMARWGHDLASGSPEQVDLIAHYLAHLAATLAGFHRPDVMVFGGGVMHASGLIESLRKRTAALVGGYLPEWSGDLATRILPPALGDRAGITGAIELGRRALETTP
jgi:fructokinase